MRYDRADRLLQAVKEGSNDTGTDWAYRYDRAGNRLNDQVEQFSGAGSSVARKQYGVNTGTDWAYRYDRAGNRLNDQVEQFTGAGSSVARKQYGINPGDQVTSSVAGGPLHVAGTLAEPGKVLQTGAVTYALTDETTPPAFAAWIDENSSASATVVATDFANQTTTSMVTVNPVGKPHKSSAV